MAGLYSALQCSGALPTCMPSPPLSPSRGRGLVGLPLTWVPNVIGEGEDEGEERMQPADTDAIEP
jgi:hypothetical protein